MTTTKCVYNPNVWSCPIVTNLRNTTRFRLICCQIFTETIQQNKSCNQIFNQVPLSASSPYPPERVRHLWNNIPTELITQRWDNQNLNTCYSHILSRCFNGGSIGLCTIMNLSGSSVTIGRPSGSSINSVSNVDWSFVDWNVINLDIWNGGWFTKCLSVQQSVVKLALLKASFPILDTSPEWETVCCLI